VSILDRDEAFLEVRASRGDTHLGGDDIDAALVRLVLGNIEGNRAAVERDPRAMTRLLEAVERAKIALSSREEVRLHEPFLAGEGEAAVHLDTTIRRQDLEAAARPFIERTLVCIDDALRDAGLKADQLDRIVMVGGASKMPLVEQMVSQRLGRRVYVDPDADRAVALGASLVAARAAGLPVDEVLVDITPHSLSVGVLDLDGDFDGDTDSLVASRVIERNTVVPVERSRTYFTLLENQDKIEIPIVQGEGQYVGDNTKLGVVWVEALPPSPAASPVNVKFRLDLSGLLHVAATHIPSGRSAEVTIADSPYRLTELKRDQARKEVQALREVRQTEQASESDVALAKAMLARADKALASGAANGGQAVRDARDALQKALGARDATVVDKMDALSDALLDLM
jgi:molecular chaperone DnaK